MHCAELELIEGFYDTDQSERLLQYFLQQHDWPDNRYEYGGRLFVLPRLQTWHADAGIRYSYSNNLLVTRPWTKVLSEIRLKVEDALNQPFNSVLVNYYRNGEDYVGWHADDEPELGSSPCIASVSFGAARTFRIRSKHGNESESLVLPAGSLLLMRPGFQRHWQHSVPADNTTTAARINLTFREVIDPAGGKIEGAATAAHH
ncbi:alpha-ketoglutarate-dependent dioxygenase AlkB family protein [Methylomonas sp. MgM2]